MKSITLNADQQTQLNGLTGPVEVRDPNGEKVGVLLSEEDYVRYLYKTAKIPLSDEEIKRRLSEPGARTLPEIWQRLGVR